MTREMRKDLIEIYNHFGSGKQLDKFYEEIKELQRMNNKKEDALYIDKRFKYRLTKFEVKELSLGEWQKTYIQVPHLGGQRYYVCEPWIITKEELPSGWGLIYCLGVKKFKKIAESSLWKADVRTERDLIAHAMRRFASGDSTGIMIRTY